MQLNVDMLGANKEITCMRLFYAVLLLILSLATTIGLADDRTLAFWSLKWSPDGQWIARAYSDGIVSITSIDPLGKQIELKYNYPLSNLTWSPDSSRLAASVRGEGQITIWDVDKPTLIHVIKTDVPYGDTGI